MNNLNNKMYREKKVNWMSVILALLFVVAIVYCISLSKERNSLEQSLKQSELDKIELVMESEETKDEFQVDEIRKCRGLTRDVLEQAYHLEQIRLQKNESCAEVINKPSDILAPQSYYEVVDNGSWDVTAVLKYQ